MKARRDKILGLLASCSIVLGGISFLNASGKHSSRPSSQEDPSHADEQAAMARVHGSSALNESLRQASLIETAPEHALPFHPNPQLNQAITLIGQSRWREAEPILLELLEKNPSDTSVLSELVTVEVMGKMNPEKAVPYLETILRVEPDFPGIWDRFQDTVASAHGQQAAIDFLKNLPAKERFEVPYTLGLFLGQEGRYAESIAAFEKSLTYESTQAGAIYQQISAMQRRQGNSEGAEKSLQKALEALEIHNENLQGQSIKQKQDILPAQISLLEVYLESGRRAEAMALLDDLLEKDPTNPYLKAYAERWKNI